MRCSLEPRAALGGWPPLGRAVRSRKTLWEPLIPSCFCAWTCLPGKTPEGGVFRSAEAGPGHLKSTRAGHSGLHFSRVGCAPAMPAEERALPGHMIAWVSYGTAGSGGSSWRAARIRIRCLVSLPRSPWSGRAPCRPAQAIPASLLEPMRCSLWS